LHKLRRLFEGALALGDVCIALLSIGVPWSIADPIPGSNNYDDDQVMIRLGIVVGLSFVFAAVRLFSHRRPSHFVAGLVGGLGVTLGYMTRDPQSWEAIWAMFGVTSAMMLLIPNPGRLLPGGGRLTSV